LVNRGREPIYLDYPVRPVPRYGWGRPPHAGLHDLIAARRDAYREILRALETIGDGLKRISRRPGSAREPHWDNPYLGGLDAASLYAFPKLFGSARYVEVGAGHSTRFVRRGVEDFGSALQITSIDPSPRASVEAVSDAVIRSRLEDAPLAIFDELGENDILMLDGSHRCFQNSDVTVAFLDVLPRLKPGVLVFIHDIFLPDDYPEIWRTRYYSEQYLLAVLLAADRGRRYEIVFPAHFCETDPAMRAETLRTWQHIAPPEQPLDSGCFWLRVKPSA
jgi:hypothetical protein